MAGDFDIRIEGLEGAIEALNALAPELRKKALPASMRKAARVISGEAKRLVPVLASATAYRRPGTVKKAIAVRSSKVARRAGDVGVFVGVKPAKGAKYRRVATVAGVSIRSKTRESQRGAKSPTDPYYWSFLEFGTKKMRARAFLRPAFDSKSNEALAVFSRAVAPQIEKLNRRAR